MSGRERAGVAPAAPKKSPSGGRQHRRIGWDFVSVSATSVPADAVPNHARQWRSSAAARTHRQLIVEVLGTAPQMLGWGDDGRGLRLRP